MTRLGKILPFGRFFCLWQKNFQEFIYYWANFWAKFYLHWANFFPSLFTIGQIFSESWVNFFSNRLVTLSGSHEQLSEQSVPARFAPGQIIECIIQPG